MRRTWAAACLAALLFSGCVAPAQARLAREAHDVRLPAGHVSFEIVESCAGKCLETRDAYATLRATYPPETDLAALTHETERTLAEQGWEVISVTLPHARASDDPRDAHAPGLVLARRGDRTLSCGIDETLRGPPAVGVYCAYDEAASGA